MGWASGSELADSIWSALRKDLDPKSLKKNARKLIRIFEDADCDTMQECDDLVKDAGFCRSCMTPLKRGKCADKECWANDPDNDEAGR